MKRTLKHFDLFWVFRGAKFLITLLPIFVTACDNGTDGVPTGPSNIGNSAFITVTPATVTIIKNGAVTFLATGGTESFTWSVDNTSVASIDTSTGELTAGNAAGFVTVTATDANGSIGTAKVTIANKTLTIIPALAEVGKTVTQEFTVTGHTEPVFWSVASTALGSIDTTTGIFTAGVTEGSTTITVLDADGDTATATVTVISNTIIVTPVSVGPLTVGTQAFTATTNGVAGTYIWTVTGERNDYSGATVTVALTPAAGTSLTFTQPSSDEGAQSLKITATDGNGDSGSATLTLTASD